MSDEIITPAENKRRIKDIARRTLEFRAKQAGMTYDEYINQPDYYDPRCDWAKGKHIAAFSRLDFQLAWREMDEADRILYHRAFVLGIEALREYLSIIQRGHLKGADRDKWLIKRLRRIREKYMQPVELD